jgi:large subunit ribosomal protein L1
VKTDVRICVIAAPDSKAAADARAAGAVLVGEDDIFAQVKEGIIEFDRCLCHVDSLQKMNKAGLGRQLGPKGLMPSTKTGTVVTDVGKSVRDLVGGSEYRERLGVIRMAVGQLGFTPEEMQRNVKTFMDALKKDIAQMSDRISKEIHEVVSQIVPRLGGMTNIQLGSELDKCTRLHTQWRLPRPEFNSGKGACWPIVNFRM